MNGNESFIHKHMQYTKKSSTDSATLISVGYGHQGAAYLLYSETDSSNLYVVGKGGIKYPVRDNLPSVETDEHDISLHISPDENYGIIFVTTLYDGGRCYIYAIDFKTSKGTLLKIACGNFKTRIFLHVAITRFWILTHDSYNDPVYIGEFPWSYVNFDIAGSIVVAPVTIMYQIECCTHPCSHIEKTCIKELNNGDLVMICGNGIFELDYSILMEKRATYLSQQDPENHCSMLGYNPKLIYLTPKYRVFPGVDVFSHMSKIVPSICCDIISFTGNVLLHTGFECGAVWVSGKGCRVATLGDAQIVESTSLSPNGEFFALLCTYQRGTSLAKAGVEIYSTRSCKCAYQYIFEYTTDLRNCNWVALNNSLRMLNDRLLLVFRQDADHIFCIECLPTKRFPPWSVQRLLWIAQLSEENVMSSLPTEIIKMILSYCVMPLFECYE